MECTLLYVVYFTEHNVKIHPCYCIYWDFVPFIVEWYFIGWIYYKLFLILYLLVDI